MLHDFAVERHEAHTVALMVYEIRETGGQHSGVVELRDAAGAIVHRLRHIQQHRKVHVRLGFVLLDVVAVRPRPEPPVHPTDVVAGHVAAVLGEIDRGSEVRCLVKAVDEAIAHGPRNELQIPDSREHHRIHEPRARNRAGRMSILETHVNFSRSGRP